MTRISLLTIIHVDKNVARVRKGYWLLNIEIFVSCDDVMVNLNLVDNGVIPALY